MPENTPTPAGFFPDPEGIPGVQRWWDGTQWTDTKRTVGGPGAAGPPPPPVKRPFYKSSLVWIIGVMAVIGIVVGSTAITKDEKPPSTDAASTTSIDVGPPPVVTSELVTPTPPTTTARRRCAPAPDQLVAIINAGFNDSGLSLSEPAFSVRGPGDLTYIGANIMRGDIRESSGDVWVAKGPLVAALSGSARRASLLPDGRDLFDANAGDDYGAAVIDCVIYQR